MEQKKVQVQIDFELFTDKNSEEIKKALTKGIYIALDSPGKHIAKPSDVKNITIYTSNE